MTCLFLKFYIEQMSYIHSLGSRNSHRGCVYVCGHPIKEDQDTQSELTVNIYFNATLC